MCVCACVCVCVCVLLLVCYSRVEPTFSFERNKQVFVLNKKSINRNAKKLVKNNPRADEDHFASALFSVTIASTSYSIVPSPFTKSSPYILIENFNSVWTRVMK